MVARALHGAGVALPDPEPILPSPDEFFYRNKMEFAFGRSREGEFQLGLHARGSFNRLINTERCLLQSTASIAIVNAVRREAAVLELPTYDLRRHEGVLRFLTVRDAKFSGAHLVNLVVGAYPRADVDRLSGSVLAQLQAITTWVTSLHEGKAQVAVGQAMALPRGTGAMVERCNGIDYQVSPRSFLQTNTRQTENLYRLVCDWAGDVQGARILDLYCGAGGVGLQLARRAGQVCGIESVPEAVTDARENAHRNGIGNCIFLEGAVEAVLPGLAHEAFPLAIVDPPRAGMHERAAAALAGLRPARILYVSCNASTLAVDLGRLALAGYGVQRWRPVDLFPQTPHCEVVVELAVGRA
jgi:23S rRNA (uracil1939-C5)-methyltransferase